MNLPANFEYYHAEVYKDRVREAERQRMIAGAGLDEPGWARRPFAMGVDWLGRLLAGIGGRMVRWSAPHLATDEVIA